MTQTGTPDQEADAILAQHWALPGTRQLPLPIDPVTIASRLGIQVYASNLEPDVSAVIVANANQAPTIYVSASDALVRQRFSCAHEIGHFVRRRASGATEFGFVDRRDHLASTGTHPEERWANQFAAALLMPTSLVMNSPQRDPQALAPLFGVSGAAMGHRLSNLGLR